MTHAHTPIWHVVNISPVERGGRVLLGLAAIIAGVVLLTSAGSVLAGVLELLLVATGLDMLITGATGHCPLHRRRRLRGDGAVADEWAVSVRRYSPH
jgi:hypothetical protein